MESQEYIDKKRNKTAAQKEKFMKKLTLSQKALSELTRVENQHDEQNGGDGDNKK